MLLCPVSNSIRPVLFKPTRISSSPALGCCPHLLCLSTFAASVCWPSLLLPGGPPEGSSLDILAAASELLHLSGKDASPPTAKVPPPQGRDHAATAAAAGGSQPRSSDPSGLTGPGGSIPGGAQNLDLLMKPDGDMGASLQLVQGPGGTQHLVLVPRPGGGGGGPTAAAARGVPSAQPMDNTLDLDALPPELRRQLLRMGAGGPGQPQVLSLGGMVGPGQVPGGAGLAVGAGGRGSGLGMGAMDALGGPMHGGGGGAGRGLQGGGGGGPTPSDAVLRQLIHAAATHNQVRVALLAGLPGTPGSYAVTKPLCTCVCELLRFLPRSCTVVQGCERFERFRTLKTKASWLRTACAHPPDR